MNVAMIIRYRPLGHFGDSRVMANRRREYKRLA